MLKQLYKMYSKCLIKLKYLFNYALDGMIKGVCLAWWLAVALTNMIVHICNYSILINRELFTPPLSFSLMYFSSHLSPLIRKFSSRIRLELKEPRWWRLTYQEKEGGCWVFLGFMHHIQGGITLRKHTYIRSWHELLSKI